MNKRHLIFLSLGLLMSCDPLSSPLNGTAPSVTVQILPYSGTFNYTYTPDSGSHDVSFIFTNPSLTNSVSGISLNGNLVVDGQSLPLPSESVSPIPSTGVHAEIDAFNQLAPNLLIKQNQSRGIPGPSATVAKGSGDTVLATQTFYLSQDTSQSLTAQCRKVVDVTLPDGRQRRLSIWVDQANPLDVTGPMADALADKFVNSLSTSSSIYNWCTALGGEPWGPQSFTNLVDWDSSKTITILLGRLNSSYTGSMVVGYFWAKDNFDKVSVSGSNERIMFYLDSFLYGKLETGEPTWNSDTYWSKTMFSTLAHEFQHMIAFYQKQVVKNAGTTSAWINEMCSMVMEDLVADKMGLPGPRGSINASGTPLNSSNRVSNFNTIMNAGLPLHVPSNPGVNDYAQAYVFGAWLSRNYGGAPLLKEMIQSSWSDTKMITEAVKKATGKDLSFGQLMSQWGAAILLSKRTDVPNPLRYNSGTWFTSTSGGINYNLGSINLFQYSPLPNIIKSPQLPPSTRSASTNVYYQAGTGISTSRTWNISLPPGMLLGVVIE